MSTFQVNDMTCGHCASTIRNALGAVDPQAKVIIDISSRRVEISSARASAAQLRSAIEQAGYTPVAFQAGSSHAGAPDKRSGGGCCG